MIPPDPDFKRLAIEHSLLDVLARMLAHDVNGKVMGVDGILSCWETMGVEVDNLKEDVGIVRDSFRGIQHEFQMLNWFFQHEGKYAQPITLGHFYDVAGRFLSRFFQPATSLTLQSGPRENSIFCTPHQLIFWTSSFCQMLGRTRPPGQLVEMQIDTRGEGSHLEIRCRSDFLSDLIEAEHRRRDSVVAWESWRTLFQEAGGTIALDTGILLPITLSLPVGLL